MFGSCGKPAIGRADFGEIDCTCMAQLANANRQTGEEEEEVIKRMNYAVCVCSRYLPVICWIRTNRQLLVWCFFTGGVTLSVG